MVVLMFVEHVFSAYLPVLFFKVEKAPVVCKDVSLCGRPRGYALDQHDKARVVLLCPSARTFLFYSEKKKYQKKAPPFAQSLRGQRVSSTLFSFGAMGLHGTGLLPGWCC